MIALGAPIVYTHEAALARKAGKDQIYPEGEWFVPRKGNGDVPHGLLGIFLEEPEARKLRPMFVTDDGTWLVSHEIEKLNKAIIAYEHPGAGVVTGLVAKLYGKSYPGEFRNSADGDYEPGYLTSHGKVELYVVRQELRGSRFVYVPKWAARVQVAA